MAQSLPPINRDQLSAFLKDYRTIRQFEQLFSATQVDLPAALVLAEEAQISAGDANATAQQAIDSISTLTDALMAVALAPPLFEAAAAGGGGGAPTNATYIVQIADASLTAERVATGSADITWDFTTPSQAALNLTTTGVGSGTYNQVTVDTKGRVTGGTNTLIPKCGTAYVNFGTTLSTRLTSTVVAAGVTPSSVVSVSWGAVQNTDDNDPEFDDITFFATPGTGQFDVTAVCQSKFSGNCRINYTVG